MYELDVTPELMLIGRRFAFPNNNRKDPANV
jgi:hypothetical protein